MFSPVKFSSGSYPPLEASVGSPYGSLLSPPTNAVENRGGPTFGLNSLSEPNTSPDVVTIATKLRDAFAPGTPPTITNITQRTYIKSGTPIAVCETSDSSKTTREGEPLHDVYVINTKFKGKYGAYINNANIRFLTVTVGDFWFEPGRVQYIAVAVQNVATVSIPPEQMDLFRSVGLGDRFYLKAATNDADKNYPFKIEKGEVPTANATNPGLSNMHYVRVLTAVAPPIGNTIRCDMGNMIRISVP